MHFRISILILIFGFRKRRAMLTLSPKMDACYSSYTILWKFSNTMLQKFSNWFTEISRIFQTRNSSTGSQSNKRIDGNDWFSICFIHFFAFDLKMRFPAKIRCTVKSVTHRWESFYSIIRRKMSKTVGLRTLKSRMSCKDGVKNGISVLRVCIAAMVA